MRNYVLFDYTVNIEDRSFWLYYDVAKGAKTKVDNISLWRDDDGTTLMCERCVERAKVEKIKEALKSFDPDDDDLLCQYESSELEVEEDDPEFPRLIVHIWSEEFGGAPNVKELSGLFNRIEKIALTKGKP